MAIRAIIAIRNTDDTYNAIYVNSFGGLEHTGRLLDQYYNTPDAAHKLIYKGDIAALGAPHEDNDIMDSDFSVIEDISELYMFAESCNVDNLYMMIAGYWSIVNMSTRKATLLEDAIASEYA